MARYETINVTKIKVPPTKSGYKTGNGLFVLTGDNKTVTADGSVAALTIPAGTYVLAAFAEIVTSAGEACTVNLGIANGEEFMHDGSLNRTAGLITSGRDYALVSGVGQGGMYFAVEDNIDATVTLNGGTGTVVFKVHAVCFRV